MVWIMMYVPTAKSATYHDPANGVSFAYPAQWKADKKLGWYLGTAILHAFETGFDLPEPMTKVGFSNTDAGPYPGTNLDGVEFVYLLVPNTTKETCYGRLSRFLESSLRSRSTVMIHGVSYVHFESGDGGLGHGAQRDIYETYLADRCYLFEAGIHTDLGSERKPLTKQQNAQLAGSLNTVMRSVHIHPPSSSRQ
jgi:hypothetical protein